MSRQAIVSDAADRDLTEIYDYLADKSGRVAYRMIVRFHEKFDELAESPEIGRPADDLEPWLRRANVGVYAIFYRAIEHSVEIARVLHGMRNLKAVFGDR